MNRILLAAIRGYWRFTPARARSFLTRGTTGTSAAAYDKISAGDGGLGTFLSAALPLRLLGRWLGVYGGEGQW